MRKITTDVAALARRVCRARSDQRMSREEFCGLGPVDDGLSPRTLARFEKGQTAHVRRSTIVAIESRLKTLR